MQSHSINVGILTRLFKEKQRKKFEAQCKLTVYFPDKVIIKETIAPEKKSLGRFIPENCLKMTARLHKEAPQS